MDGFTFEDLKAVVEYSSVCFGIYHRSTRRITAPNEALRQRLESDSVSVWIVSDEDGRLYGRIDNEGIPVSLRVLTGEDATGGCLVEVYLANAKSTRDNSPTSDLIQLVDMTSDGVWEWFPSLQYEFMSERFWSILGYDHREMPSSPDAWMGIVDPGDLTIATKMYNDHVATKGVAEYNCNVAYTHKNGREVQVKCRGAVVEWLPDGSPWRLLGTHTDITEITGAVDAKARFVSRMSHEIRTPICAILNECEMLEQNAATSVISDACDQLLALCNDILTVGKLRKPMSMAAFRRSAAVEDFFHKAVRRHSGQVHKKGLSLESNVVAVPSVPLMMDVSKCNQVVDNLVSNAIKYTEAGGQLFLELNCRPSASVSSSENVISLTNATTPEAIQKWKGQDREWEVELTVRDTGKGIHNDDREFVFAKFSQANSSMQGAGLGLSISKELAQLMQGDVYLKDSEVGKGSTFAFTFPASIANPLEVEDPGLTVTEGANAYCKTPSNASKLDDCSPIRILSADDMLTNRKIMRRRIRALEEQLQNVTVEVIDATNGTEAVSIFREGGKFDLIFMDCLMPEMNGFEAAKEIHRLCDERGMHRVPVVAVTASVSTGLHEECRDAGIVQVVTKPFGAMDLMPILNSAVGLRLPDSPKSPGTSTTQSTPSNGSPADRTSREKESAAGQTPTKMLTPSSPPLPEPRVSPTSADQVALKRAAAPPERRLSLPRHHAVSPSPCPRALPQWRSGTEQSSVRFARIGPGWRAPSSTITVEDSSHVGGDPEVGTE